MPTPRGHAVAPLLLAAQLSMCFAVRCGEGSTAFHTERGAQLVADAPDGVVVRRPDRDGSAILAWIDEQGETVREVTLDSPNERAFLFVEDRTPGAPIVLSEWSGPREPDDILTALWFVDLDGTSHRVAPLETAGLRYLSTQANLGLLYFEHEVVAYGPEGARFHLALDAETCCDVSLDPHQILITGQDESLHAFDAMTGAELAAPSRDGTRTLRRTEHFDFDVSATETTSGSRPNVRRRDGGAAWTTSASPWWVLEDGEHVILPARGGVLVYTREGALVRSLPVAGDVTASSPTMARSWIVDSDGIAGDVYATNVETGERRLVTRTQSDTLDACQVAPTWTADATTHGIVVHDRGSLSLYPLPD
ncbi:MAG: hypothetical protein U0234_29430 [Sandaracinus sp.]